jgi:hypothetical protein
MLTPKLMNRKKRLIEVTKADPDAKPQPEHLKTPTASTAHSTENPNPRNPFFPVKNTPRAQPSDARTNRERQEKSGKFAP